MHLLVIEGLRDIKITLELLIKFLLSGDMKYLYDQKSSFIMWKIYSYYPVDYPATSNLNVILIKVVIVVIIRLSHLSEHRYLEQMDRSWKSMVFSGYSKFYHHNIEINAKITRKMINLPSFNC